MFEFVALSMPAAPILNANSALVGKTECIVISSLVPLALNSADGGWLLSLDPASLGREHALVWRANAALVHLDR